MLYAKDACNIGVSCSATTINSSVNILIITCCTQKVWPVDSDDSIYAGNADPQLTGYFRLAQPLFYQFYDFLCFASGGRFPSFILAFELG